MTTSEADPGAPPSPRPGDEIDGFRLIEELPALAGELALPLFRGERLVSGEGVLMAPLELAPGTSASDLELFYQRSVSLAQVDVVAQPSAHHPPAQLAPLVASSSPSAGSPPTFLCWRLAPGETLRYRLRSSYPDPESALRIVYGVAQQLAAIHSTGEFHGGLCPANVLIGGHDYGQLLAPGIARPLIGARSSTEPAQPLVLAALYRAPEQFPGGRGAVGPATDVFAIGLLLFELIECDRPFHAASLALLREQIERHSPPDLLSAPGALPEELFELVAQTLEPDPAKRLRSAAPVVEVLDRLLAQTRSTAAPKITAAVGAVARSTGPGSTNAGNTTPEDTGRTAATTTPAHDDQTRVARFPIDDQRRRQAIEDIGLWSLWLLPSLVLAGLVALALWFWLR